MKWSIRLKFLLVMVGLLGVCLGVYLFMAVTVFKSDKTELVYDLNRSQVSNLASELEAQFGGVSEKLKIFAQLPTPLQDKMAPELFSDESEIVAVSIYKADAENRLRAFTQKKFLETYGLDEPAFNTLLTRTPIPFSDITRDGQAIWNASHSDGPPLIGYGRLVVLQDQRGIPIDQWAVIGYLKIDRFLKSVSIVRLSEIVVTNRGGEVLVQRDAKALAEKPKINEHPLFKAAEQSKTRLGVSTMEFEHSRWMAAHARAFSGQLFVIAKAPENEVFRVVRDLGIRTLLFGIIVLTLVILAAFLISRSLTHNIAMLTERMEAVSEGDLSTVIHLEGRDETVQLATTFNQMIFDLKTSRDQLEEMNRELDQKVKDRTIQLEEQNQKVKEAQEALLRTTRMASVGELAGKTAHEVLNPLTSLLTRAGLMQKRVTNEYQSQLALLEEIRGAWKKDFSEGGFDKLIDSWKSPSRIDPKKTLFQEDLDNLQAISTDLTQQSKHISTDTKFIQEEGSRIGKIINGMRRLGHTQSDARAYSLHSVLGDCCHIMADLFDQRGFKIERRFEAVHDQVLIDRDEIIQAVTNLMRNSLQALETSVREGHHSAKPRMSVRTYNDEKGQVFVELEDNGVGVPKEHQTQLFDSSFTTKSTDEGTGLGLGISRRFVRSYGGDIEFVSSIPGIKTLFRVHIPLLQSNNKTGAVA